MNRHPTKEEIFSNKDLREKLEIDMFLKVYNKKYDSDFLVFKKGENPDYFIKDSKGNLLGVELSSVYMDDRVVGQEHKRNELIEIPYDSNSHREVRDKYFNRIVDKIEEKANKIKTGQYDTSYPIILSLYLNDYYCIHIDEPEWKYFIKSNNDYFSQRHEFKEVFFIR